MNNQIGVVDIFSGAGGLAEGFAALRDPSGLPFFKILFSVEKDEAAHRSSRLRNFLRKFPSEFPPEYYDFLNGIVTEEPDWPGLYPVEWKVACDETQCLNIGTPESDLIIQKRVDQIRHEWSDDTILIGGPPCQTYSNLTKQKHFDYFDNDRRQTLYEEYCKILTQLQPSIAVLENVKGMLSAEHYGERVFPNVVNSLMNAGGPDRYRLFSLDPYFQGMEWGVWLQSKDFLIEAEQYGVPQIRHRLFIVCIREDIAEKIPADLMPMLEKSERVATVHDVLGAMPKLRSRLKNETDDGLTWQQELLKAHELICRDMPEMDPELRAALDLALQSTRGDPLPYKNVQGKTDLPDTCPDVLRDWIVDRNLTQLLDNEAKPHNEDDRARALYAAAYGIAFGRSPLDYDFPSALAPDWKKWLSGNFKDSVRVQVRNQPAYTVTTEASSGASAWIHYDPAQCRTLTVRERPRGSRHSLTTTFFAEVAFSKVRRSGTLLRPISHIRLRVQSGRR